MPTVYRQKVAPFSKKITGIIQPSVAKPKAKNDKIYAIEEIKIQSLFPSHFCIYGHVKPDIISPIEKKEFLFTKIVVNSDSIFIPKLIYNIVFRLFKNQ